MELYKSADEKGVAGMSDLLPPSDMNFSLVKEFSAHVYV